MESSPQNVVRDIRMMGPRPLPAHGPRARQGLLVCVVEHHECVVDNDAPDPDDPGSDESCALPAGGEKATSEGKAPKQPLGSMVVITEVIICRSPLVWSAMSETLKVRKVGNSSGVILPKGLLEQMGVEEGDELFAVREADGSLRLTPYDPAFAEAVEDARKFMDSHRNAFRELAE